MRHGLISFLFIESRWVKYEDIFGAAFRRLGLNCKLYPLPALPLEQRTLSNIMEIRRLISRLKRDSFVIFCPGSEELYLPEPDHLLVFSAYRSWGNSEKMTLIPHPWSAVRHPSEQEVVWDRKPPLSIGFMGTGYAQSKIAKLARYLPKTFRQLLLRSYHLQWPSLIGLFNSYGLPLKGLNAFARIETIARLKQDQTPEVEVLDKVGFSGTDAERNDFVKHLIRNTYVVCPRGFENFSFRTYEALRYGRVPVIIDTDMRLPPQIDWNNVALRVPYTKLNQIHSIIRYDYDSKRASQFLARQRLALTTCERLNSNEWIDEAIKDCVMGRSSAAT